MDSKNAGDYVISCSNKKYLESRLAAVSINPQFLGSGQVEVKKKRIFRLLITYF